MADLVIDLAHEPEAAGEGDALVEAVLTLPSRDVSASRVQNVGVRLQHGIEFGSAPRNVDHGTRSMSDAIARYHDLLAAGSLAADSQARLETLPAAPRAVLRHAAGLHRPAPAVPHAGAVPLPARPRRACCCRRSRRSTTARSADPAFRKQFRLRDWEDELLDIDPGFPRPQPDEPVRLVLRLRTAN